MESTVATDRPAIKIRSPELRFDATIPPPARPPPPKKPRSPAPLFDPPTPRHWLADNAFATHLSNGVNLLFPAGERFFVRSVRFYQEEIRDPVLSAQVKGFFGQEGRHA